MADFAYVIDHLRQPASAGGWGASGSAILGFGGSYGGMIAAWFRMHYPNAVDGVIAASAPIWSFSGLDPPYDFAAFAEGGRPSPCPEDSNEKKEPVSRCRWRAVQHCYARVGARDARPPSYY